MSGSLLLLVGGMVAAAILMVTGIVMVLLEGSGVQRGGMSEDEAGALFAGRHPTPPGINIRAGKSVFRGNAVKVSGSAEISIGEVVAAVRQGRVLAILPWLMTIAGFFAVLLLVAPLLWMLVAPWAGVGWLILLIVTFVQGYRNRDKADGEGV